MCCCVAVVSRHFLDSSPHVSKMCVCGPMSRGWPVTQRDEIKLSQKDSSFLFHLFWQREKKRRVYGRIKTTGLTVKPVLRHFFRFSKGEVLYVRKYTNDWNDWFSKGRKNYVRGIVKSIGKTNNKPVSYSKYIYSSKASMTKNSTRYLGRGCQQPLP